MSGSRSTQIQRRSEFGGLIRIVRSTTPRQLIVRRLLVLEEPSARQAHLLLDLQGLAPRNPAALQLLGALSVLAHSMDGERIAQSTLRPL